MTFMHTVVAALHLQLLMAGPFAAETPSLKEAGRAGSDTVTFVRQLDETSKCGNAKLIAATRRRTRQGCISACLQSDGCAAFQWASQSQAQAINCRTYYGGRGAARLSETAPFLDADVFFDAGPCFAKTSAPGAALHATTATQDAVIAAPPRMQHKPEGLVDTATAGTAGGRAERIAFAHERAAKPHGRMTTPSVPTGGVASSAQATPVHRRVASARRKRWDCAASMEEAEEGEGESSSVASDSAGGAGQKEYPVSLGFAKTGTYSKVGLGGCRNESEVEIPSYAVLAIKRMATCRQICLEDLRCTGFEWFRAYPALNCQLQDFRITSSTGSSPPANDERGRVFCFRLKRDRITTSTTPAPRKTTTTSATETISCKPTSTSAATTMATTTTATTPPGDVLEQPDAYEGYDDETDDDANACDSNLCAFNTYGPCYNSVHMICASFADTSPGVCLEGFVPCVAGRLPPPDLVAEEQPDDTTSTSTTTTSTAAPTTSTEALYTPGNCFGQSEHPACGNLVKNDHCLTLVQTTLCVCLQTLKNYLGLTRAFRVLLTVPMKAIQTLVVLRNACDAFAHAAFMGPTIRGTRVENSGDETQTDYALFGLLGLLVLLIPIVYIARHKTTRYRKGNKLHDVRLSHPPPPFPATQQLSLPPPMYPGRRAQAAIDVTQPVDLNNFKAADFGQWDDFVPLTMNDSSFILPRSRAPLQYYN
eukprot:gene13239-28253_t